MILHIFRIEFHNESGETLKNEDRDVDTTEVSFINGEPKPSGSHTGWKMYEHDSLSLLPVPSGVTDPNKRTVIDTGLFNTWTSDNRD